MRPLSVPSTDPGAPVARVVSVDALRGLVMFLMIFVNDLAGAGRIVPDWMVHFSDRHADGSGMTFVDLVFPAFLFLVGMSVPLALGGRIARGQTAWQTLGHIVVRSLSLLWIGILMVHETPDTTALGWPGNLWCVLMYFAAIATFSSITLPNYASASVHQKARVVCWLLRWAGLAALIGLALAFRGPTGQRIINFSPFSLETRWYGILGLIGWAYLVTGIVFLVFGSQRTAILGCMTLLMCLFAAEKGGLFDGFWLGDVVGIGGTLGSQASISVAGLLLGSILNSADMRELNARARFTFWFVTGCSAAAFLLNSTYGISKNQATPSWCLWACAITAAFWFLFHLVSDVKPLTAISKPLALAGQNVLLAYLVSMMLPSLLNILALGDAYGQLAASLPAAVTRSATCAVLILAISTGLNRIGFQLRL